MTNRFTWSLALLLAGGLNAGAQLALRYDEASERVTIYRGENAVPHQYDAARKGFVAADGGQVAWDDATRQWQWRSGAGALLGQFDAAGRQVAASAGAPPARPGGYNPLNDVGDTAGAAAADLQPAWKYLETRDQTTPDSASPMSGDEGGPAAEFGDVGGNAADRERELREKWQGQKGAHQGDPEGAMETGAPSDPLGKLRDTLKQAATAVRDVRQTATEINSIDDELRGENTGLFNGTGGGGAMGGAADGGASAGAAPGDVGGAAAAPAVGGAVGAPADASGGRMAAPADATVIPSPIPDDGRMR